MGPDSTSTGWLARVNSLIVDRTNANTIYTGVSKGGDANNDNTVDVLDLDQLILSFDRCQGDANYNASTDFNCDNCTNVVDLDILVRHFDVSGKE